MLLLGTAFKGEFDLESHDKILELTILGCNATNSIPYDINSHIDPIENVVRMEPNRILRIKRELPGQKHWVSSKK